MRTRGPEHTGHHKESSVSGVAAPQASSSPEGWRWEPTLGACLTAEGVRFQVWAPDHPHLELVWEAHDSRGVQPLHRQPDGTHTGLVHDIGAGTRYWYRLEDGTTLPDPASRCQPDGVHGPSEVIDAIAFPWTDHQWRGVSLPDLVIYELHVGTFSEPGTFSGVVERLEYLAMLGVTAIELMPIAEFGGRWNWGYDGVDLFAPSHHYGTPDDLRRLVNAAHRRGLAVLLDVVYNHLGPDGAYLATFSRAYFTDRHHTPWGQALNLDGPGSEHVRRFFVENALHWMHEYHLDGLRFDATHELRDDSPRHLLADISEAVHSTVRDRAVLITAEDERNSAALCLPVSAGGAGVDAVWADDFHHQVRRAVAGDNEGYFKSYSGTAPDIARTIERGWFYSGQIAAHTGEPRGTDPSPLQLEQFIFCIQNHDQVGNRALGERLDHQIAGAAYRAASALLLCAPETPLLFMGQEWGASTPFLYFTDHHEELGRAITEGRRAEFAGFSAFNDPATRSAIPDPQDPATVAASRLRWCETSAERHLPLLRLYRALLALRRTHPAMRCQERDSVTVLALDDSTIALWRHAAGAEPIAILVRLSGSGTVWLPAHPNNPGATNWRKVLTTEDAAFTVLGKPPVVTAEPSGLTVAFAGPAGIILRAESH